MPALFTRHFPQPDLSTVVAPSGGVQQTAVTQQRGNGHRTSKPAQERVTSSFKGADQVTSTSAPPLCFLFLPSLATPSFSEAFKALMGCKQYARMLGLSRGYPYILYLSLSKWDAAPSAQVYPQGSVSVRPRAKSSVARWSCARGFAIVSSFSVACPVAAHIPGALTPASQLGSRSGA